MLAKLTEESRYQFHKQFPDAKFIPNRDCVRDHLRWDNLDLQLNHLRCLSDEKRKLLRHVYRKVTRDVDGVPSYWKNQKAWASYDVTASIIAMSSYENRDDFIYCGCHGYSCSDRLLCLRCCYNLLAEPAVIEFGSAFGADKEVYFIVLSLSREPDERRRIIFKDLNKSEMEQIKATGCYEQGALDDYGIPFSAPEDALDARIYWEIYARAIHEFTGRNKPLSGAFGGPEMSVRFQPLGGLPHANYVGFASGLTSDKVRDLRRIIRDKLRGCRRIKHELYPKVCVYRLLAKDDLPTVIKYCFKPINIAIPYVLSAAKLEYEPFGMKQLNRDVDVFLDLVDIAFEGLDRMARYGICSPSAGDYIGTVSEKRLARRAQDAVRREEKRKETKAIKEKFPEYQPHKRRMTEDERHRQFLTRAFYRKALRDGEYQKDMPALLKRASKTQ